MELKDILNIIAAQKVQFVDFKVIDLWGKWRHVTIPATDLTEATLHEGIGFDASNLGSNPPNPVTWSSCPTSTGRSWIPTPILLPYPS